jgi:hypothetical protein
VEGGGLRVQVRASVCRVADMPFGAKGLWVQDKGKGKG